MKLYLLYWLNSFILKGHKFSQMTEMNIKTISDKRNMSFQYYIKNPMHMVERRLNMTISKKPHLINELDGIVSLPLIIKHSHIPFNN